MASKVIWIVKVSIFKMERFFMVISAAYIVKNEEQNLEKSLKSLGDNAHEIIVVDTGSTDRTKKIAEFYGAKIYDYSWKDDFAAARNFALGKTMGDWVIFIDADEVFVNSEGLADYIGRADAYPDCEALLLPLFNINTDTGSENAELISREYSLRIWRNNPSFRFYGCVHETLMVKDKGHLRSPKMIKAHEKFTLHHTGYRKGIVPEKYKKYLQMLQREIKEKGEQPLSARYLADCYFGLGDYEQTAYYAQRAINREKEMGIVTVAGVYKLYRYWLEAGKKLSYPLPQLQEIAQQALQDTRTEFHAQDMKEFIRNLRIFREIRGKNE